MNLNPISYACNTLFYVNLKTPLIDTSARNLKQIPALREPEKLVRLIKYICHVIKIKEDQVSID